MIDKQEIAVSTIKSILGNVPIVGTALDEILFEHRGRIKQKRIEHFVEMFSETINELRFEQVDIDQMHKEDFSDFFETLIIQVTKNRSEEKIKRFRNLLMNQLTNPIPLDEAELFLEILNSLKDQQIVILQELSEAAGSNFIAEYGQWFHDKVELEKLNDRIKAEQFVRVVESDESMEIMEARRNLLENRMRISQNNWEGLQKPFQPETYRLSHSEFVFYVQDLCSKGLLIDKGMEYPGTPPLKLIEITSLGVVLLNRLKYTD